MSPPSAGVRGVEGRARRRMRAQRCRLRAHTPPVPPPLSVPQRAGAQRDIIIRDALHADTSPPYPIPPPRGSDTISISEEHQRVHGHDAEQDFSDPRYKAAACAGTHNTQKRGAHHRCGLLAEAGRANALGRECVGAGDHSSDGASNPAWATRLLGQTAPPLLSLDPHQRTHRVAPPHPVKHGRRDTGAALDAMWGPAADHRLRKSSAPAHAVPVHALARRLSRRVGERPFGSSPLPFPSPKISPAPATMGGRAENARLDASAPRLLLPTPSSPISLPLGAMGTSRHLPSAYSMFHSILCSPLHAQPGGENTAARVLETFPTPSPNPRLRVETGHVRSPRILVLNPFHPRFHDPRPVGGD
ncbi:hypothetical protein DFH07DRAFT_955121 [Mycena maculata]|uniref:Uncharacterized protein n=1 Tax=Mycena maculata TaxID=230809 RepID=A0AAD7JPW9_9AGAR|nr:hypothetical protein DFH07DRAFT_955121 [Mycena maculata]